MAAATTTYKVKLTRPQVFLWRMTLFLILAVLLAIILDGQTQQIRHSFMANPGLNTLIIGVLLVGIVYAFRQVLRLYPEIAWVNNFRISDPASTSEKSTPVLLAPMATMLRDRTGHLSLAAGSMRSLLDSVASRLEEQRETTRYLVGLLIFLGLLGTFWGLLQTVSSVGATIGTLDTNAGENTLLFDQLKEGLAGPLKGMGTAFSCSMFGLAGSLILGFLDLQAGHAQGRFYNELEDWLSGITELQPADAVGAAAMPPQLRFALIDMQRSISDLNDKVELRLLNDNTGDAVKDLAAGVDKLIRQMRAEQKVVREWADEQAQQQHELATVLRQITDEAKLPLREERG
ncbi:MAG TPA: flagellar motor protein MotA [Methyloceanibacter sp.]|jgi:hypothetical protein|nr:flagellar motor protein MotA [Methyloceanibacter sp.]